MKTSVITSFKALALLLQKAGPYLLLEIVLPGGTIFALLLFLYRRREQANGMTQKAAGVTSVHVPGDVAWTNAHSAGSDV